MLHHPSLEEQEDRENWMELVRLKARFNRLRVEAGPRVTAWYRDRGAAIFAGIAKTGRIELPADLQSHEQADYEAVASSPLFDPSWYCATYQDVARAGSDPVLHYLRHGWREDRRPGPAFDGQQYLSANPDVAEADINPLLHFLRCGAREARSLAPPNGGATSLFPDQSLVRVSAELRSYEEFVQFMHGHAQLFSDAVEAQILDHVRSYGTTTLFQGHIEPGDVIVAGDDLREHLITAGLNSRHRAIADCVLSTLHDAGVPRDEARIYGHEAITPLARMMRERFIRFIGSEYAPSVEEQRRIFPVEHNDVCASRFADASFDIIFSCDVLEHVYDRDLMLSEAARTLRSGGTFVASFPFDHDAVKGWLFAEVVGDAIKHHLEEPIYHGNPMSEGGSLVFEIPGWDIVERARRAGFEDAAMQFVCDQEKGIVASGIGRDTHPRGVFLFIGHKL